MLTPGRQCHNGIVLEDTQLVLVNWRSVGKDITHFVSAMLWVKTAHWQMAAISIFTDDRLLVKHQLQAGPHPLLCCDASGTFCSPSCSQHTRGWLLLPMLQGGQLRPREGRWLAWDDPASLMSQPPGPYALKGRCPHGVLGPCRMRIKCQTSWGGKLHPQLPQCQISQTESFLLFRQLWSLDFGVLKKRGRVPIPSSTPLVFFTFLEDFPPPGFKSNTQVLPNFKIYRHL